jgi:4-diphosphocytidyl-2-C-methyl-D-erythritol kinase
MCAGMAGGSSDAAAVMKALNSLYGNPLSERCLTEVSSVLGADVPFCIRGGTMRAEGIGDILTPVSPMPQKRLLIVKPPISVSTPEAYAGLELSKMPHPDTQAAVDALKKGDMNALYNCMGNSFEYSIFRKAPEIADVKNKILSFGADASLMSGSGSAVFGIFENEKRLHDAFEYFKDKYDDVFISRTINE